MKIDRRLKTTLGLLTCVGVMASASVHAANTYHIAINTSTLVSTGNAPFYLDFQMQYGGVGVGNNSTITNFNFGGGSVTGTANTTGNASGSIASTVALSDTATSFGNELFQSFAPGATLSFDVTLSNNVTGQTPDDLEIAILDKTTGQIPTTQPTGSNDPQNGTDGLSLVDFQISGNGKGNTITVNAYNGANNPSLGGDYSGVTTSVAAVPEPSSWALAGLCVAMFAFLRRRLVRG